MVVEIPVTEARVDFSELINRVGYGGERIVITRHGKPLVALVPVSEFVPETAHEENGTLTVLNLAADANELGPTQGIAAQHSSDPQARR